MDVWLAEDKSLAFLGGSLNGAKAKTSSSNESLFSALRLLWIKVRLPSDDGQVLVQMLT